MAVKYAQFNVTVRYDDNDYSEREIEDEVKSIAPNMARDLDEGDSPVVVQVERVIERVNLSDEQKYGG